MAIVTFWNNGKEQTGKTSSIIAIATQMAIEHNYKVLIVSTDYEDNSLDNAFWEEKKKQKSLGLFGPNTNLALEEGIVGLTKIIKSNKLTAELITNYSKIIFKNRLEIIQAFKGEEKEYNEVRRSYTDVINLANTYYDFVFVDLDSKIKDSVREAILANSNLIVATLSQKLTEINAFMELREERPILSSRKTLLLIGRYDKFSKYNVKNISRYMGEKNKVSTIPYNTLFFEACEEAKVPDLFLRLRKTDEEDRNGFFISEIRRTIENIIYRLQDLQMKM